MLALKLPFTDTTAMGCCYSCYNDSLLAPEVVDWNKDAPPTYTWDPATGQYVYDPAKHEAERRRLQRRRARLAVLVCS